MRRGVERAADGLVARPWALVALVALVVVIPILILGELSASDTQRRLRAERLALGAQAAERGAEAIGTQLSLSIQQLQNLGLCLGTCNRPELIAGIRLGDRIGVKIALSAPDYAAAFTDIVAIDVVDQSGTVLATVTPVSGFTGGTAAPAVASVADRTYFRQARAGSSLAFGPSTQPLYLEHPVVIAVPVGEQNSASIIGVLLGEVSGDDLAGHLRSQLGPFDDLYVVDDTGHLIGRAAHRPSEPIDLTKAPVIQQILAGTRVAGELLDPVSGAVALLTSAPIVVNGKPGWSVVAVQTAGGVESETAGALGQQRALRLALVAILLLGSFAFARIAEASLRQRRLLASAIAQVEQKSREVEAANRHKSEFLANMSHELRTPLNAIIGFSQVLSQRMFGELNPKQSEYLDDIQASGQHLLAVINDILDLSKVEAGKMELEPTTFSLADALKSVLMMVRERAVAHGISLTDDVDPAIEMVADQRKIKQVVLNLLTNAVKFTPAGGRVELRASREAGTVTVSVADTGVGIAPADQARVFEEFAQARAAASAEQEGTGLGLSLSRRFVELHGGRMWVASEPGKGSVFTFTVPDR